MEASNVVALVAAGLAAIVAVWVPWLAFRFALRQERLRWLHEQRAQLYTEMLTEAFDGLFVPKQCERLRDLRPDHR
ncbi:hypothetical protein OH779_40275 [Actinacidiphila glaucinigra]|uniref:hypothetical protein n=1 Tax=Actinacidiphila glaucinigra TaxID=235986 RepID=UPI0038669477